MITFNVLMNNLTMITKLRGDSSPAAVPFMTTWTWKINLKITTTFLKHQ